MKNRLIVFLISFILVFFVLGAIEIHPVPPPTLPNAVILGVIGDFGRPTFSAAAVPRLVSSWGVEAVITVGDNNYPIGAADTYWRNVILPYGKWIRQEKYFPALGNHDWGYPWDAGWKADEIPQFDFIPYLEDYPPAQGRYYEVVFGENLVQAFIVDSDAREPDGRSADSIQGRWFKDQLEKSTAKYKLIFMHEPPYSSCMFGSNQTLAWPFKEWGADIVIAGHCHNYERLEVDGFPYIIDGLGGANDLSGFDYVRPDSLVRYLDSHGAILIEANSDRMEIYFITIFGQVIDNLTIFGILP